MAESWMIVDGYNLIARHKSLNHSTLELDRHALARMFEPLLGDMAARITLVFDGRAARIGREADAGVEILYSGGHLSADELIADLIRSSSSPENILVISSDRFVRNAAEAAGANSEAAGIFLAHLQERQERAGQRVPPPNFTLADVLPSALELSRKKSEKYST